MGGIILTRTFKTRDQARLEANGILAEPYNLANNASQTLMTSQALQASLVGLVAGDVVTGVAVAVQANSASLTLARVGLYDTSGNLLASSANSASIYDAGAGTVVTRAFSATYTVPTTGGYYAAILNVGTTPATLYRGTNATIMEGVNGGVPRYVKQLTQADLPSTATFVEETVSYWIAVY